MSYHLTTDHGGTEAVIDDNCGLSKFYAIANTLAEELQVKFLTQIDDADSLDWDFQYKENFLTLHYSIFNGVSILPLHLKSAKKQNNAVLELAQFLEERAY
ncbi:MAG: hypothetical protein WCJ85_04335 [Chitinophagaceae bacterium]